MVGGVLSYAGQNSANKQAAKAAKQQGYVDTVTTRKPLEGTQVYRDAGMEAAYQTLFGQAPPNGNAGRPIVAGDPNAVAAGGGGGRPAPPPGMRYNKSGKLVKPKNAGAATAGGGGGAAAPAPFAGMSGETDEIRRRMMEELPAANADLYEAGEGYTEDTLAGNSRNPLLGRATDAADQIAEDPRLSAYQDWLMGELGIDTGGKAGAGGPARPGGGSGGATIRYLPSGTSAAEAAMAANPAAFQTLPKSATGTDAALRKLVAGEDAPGLAAATEAIKRQVGEERAEAIRNLRGRAVGSGFYGGSIYQDMEAQAIAEGDQELADSLAAARFGAFQNALGLGTEYDLGMADISARERMNEANARASSSAAGAGAAAQEKLAKMGFLGDMLGLGEQSRFGRAGALGDLAGLVSDDQGRALGAVTDLTGSRRADLGVAGDLSLGADANRNAFAAARGNERVGMAGVNLGRSELAFDRERFYDPFSRLSQYTDILNGMYGAYGSEETHGRDTRSAAPPAFNSPIGAGLTGAAIGGQVGSTFNRERRAGA